MSDLREFEMTRKRRGPPCSVGTLLARLQQEAPERYDKLRAAMAAPHIMHTQIRRVVEAWGYEVSLHMIGQHRRGDCSCRSI